MSKQVKVSRQCPNCKGTGEVYEQKRLDRPELREKIVKDTYTIMANELSQFIDEFKVDVRKPFTWEEISGDKRAYWYSRFETLIPDIDINEALTEQRRYFEDKITEAKNIAKKQVCSEISSRIANIEINAEDAIDFRSQVVDIAIGLGKA